MATLRDTFVQAEKALRGFWRRADGRWNAVRTASDTTSEKAYLAGLTAAEPRRRWQAAAGLGRNPLRSPEAVAALIVALADPEPIVRWHAAEALARQEVGHVFPALTAALAAPNPLRRAGAAEALGRLGGEAATQQLVKYLEDPDAQVRAAVARALAQTADPTAVAGLLPLLADPDVRVGRAAAYTLGRIGDTRAAAHLAAALGKPDQPLLLRRALAAALARVPHPDTQPQLLTALVDPDPQVRGYAARALGHVGNEAAHAALEAAKADQTRLIRGTVGERAERALVMLERRGRRTPSAKPVDGA